MSLLESASLILTPNGYKSGKLYSIVPSNGLGDFTFTRATSASRTNSSGLIETVLTGVPRLNYSGSVPHWLLEPQRTNLLTYSSTFTNVSWGYNSLTPILNSIILSPDGTTNAYKISRNSVSASSYVVQSTTSPSGSLFTSTIYAKLGDVSTNFGLRVQGPYPQRGDALFNLSTGTLIGVANGGSNINTSGSIQSVGNGWYRCSVTTAFTASITAPEILYSPTALTIIGAFEALDGALSNCYVWGAQLETGSYATSYIPTTTSTVTRNADITLVTGVSSLIGQTEGTLFIEWAPGDLGLDTNSNIMGIYSSTGNNRLSLYLDVYGGTPHLTIDLTKNSTSTYFTPAIPLTNTNFRKLAVVYKSNSMYIFENGVKIYTNNSTGVTFPLTEQLEILTFSPNNKTNKVRNAQMYPIALTDTECLSLTTL